MTCPMSRFGDGGHDRCSMGPNVGSLERASFSPKLPCLWGVEVERYVLGLQCHSCGWNIWLKWFGWLNRTWGTYPMSRFGDGAHARCSMGPKRSLEEGRF